MKIIFYLALSLLFLLSSCKEELPDNNCCDCEAPMTETGAGTISFDLDGTTWSPCNTNSKNGSSPKISISRNTGNGNDYLQIKGTKLINAGDESIFLHFWYPQKGIIPHAVLGMGQVPNGLIRVELFADNPKYSNFYSSDTLYPFHLEITHLDSISKIISGVFYGTLVEDDGGIDTSTIQIKNGRFDTHYY